MQLSITGDLSEMIQIAKAIVKEKKDYYTDETLDGIRSEIKHHKPEYSSQEIEDTLYQSIYFYWAYGATTDEFFYLHLFCKSHDEIKTYVTKREKVIYTNMLNRIEDAHILQNKYETYQKFKPFYKREMLLCDSDGSYDAFRKYVEKHPIFVVKPLKLGGGKGIHREDLTGFTDEQIHERFTTLINETSSMNDKLNSWGGKNGFVLEEFIEQADELAAFHPESVNVVRVPTIWVGDEIYVYQPWLKTGTGNSFVDNAHSGGLLAGINAETGVIDSDAISEIPEIFTEHPDSHIKFIGYQIPRWDELVSIANQLARQLPTIKYIGWDMALTKDGWVLVEGNFRGEFDWQMFRQRGMKAEFEALTGLRITKEFWWQNE